MTPAPTGPGSPGRPRPRSLFRALRWVATVAYPLAIYVGLTHLGAREVALLLMLLGAALWIPQLRAPGTRGMLAVPLSIAALAALAAVLDDARFILALPALINLALLFAFARTLRTGPPMIERFARLLVPSLSPAEVRYCRTVTRVWCAFFVANGSASAALALWATHAWWAAYTGGIAYLLMGALFLIELVVRRWRFRRTGLPVLDRLLDRRPLRRATPR